MDIKSAVNKLKTGIDKYKYVCIVLLVGLTLLLLPDKKQETAQEVSLKQGNIEQLDTIELSEILQSVEGAGQVRVMLSVASGEKMIYQTDRDLTKTGENSSEKYETVIVTDSQRNETGLINQVNPPVYLGAIVVCQGADSLTIRLAITQAVSKITGLGTDKICVLKMK